MSETTRAFGAFLRERYQRGIEALLDRMRAESRSYAAEDHDTLRATVTQTLQVVVEALATDASEAMLGQVRAVGEMRAESGFLLDDMLVAIHSVRDYVWGFFDEHLAAGARWSHQDVRGLEDLFHLLSRTLIMGYSQTYQQIRRAVAAQAEELEAQRSTIRELSTPILPLFEGVLALPLVGSMDSYRATQVMETLLTTISERQADIVILDITGVPVVDTSVANYLLQTARAAQLVGAQVVLVGIGAEIAQTLVQLGVDLTQLKVHANLQAGIQYALGVLGHTIT